LLFWLLTPKSFAKIKTRKKNSYNVKIKIFDFIDGFHFYEIGRFSHFFLLKELN